MVIYDENTINPALSTEGLVKESEPSKKEDINEIVTTNDSDPTAAENPAVDEPATIEQTISSPAKATTIESEAPVKESEVQKPDDATKGTCVVDHFLFGRGSPSLGY